MRIHFHFHRSPRYLNALVQTSLYSARAMFPAKINRCSCPSFSNTLRVVCWLCNLAPATKRCVFSSQSSAHAKHGGCCYSLPFMWKACVGRPQSETRLLAISFSVQRNGVQGSHPRVPCTVAPHNVSSESLVMSTSGRLCCAHDEEVEALLASTRPDDFQFLEFPPSLHVLYISLGCG